MKAILPAINPSQTRGGKGGEIRSYAGIFIYLSYELYWLSLLFA
jgi:hypothetical protein